MSDLFADLPWFLQEHVHSSGWTEWRSIQKTAYEHFTGGSQHILICAGTSSGKTEAAMFPIISSLHREPTKGFGALYIGPLKALIDDQFERIEPILRDSYIPITGWHGDISQSRKRKAVSNPSGILQITPESLQNILVNRQEELPRLFGDLRFIVIDEVHAFMNSDRGLQLLCCLERLERLTGCRPRRLGLSATISDKTVAGEWLSANTGIGTVVVSDDSIGDRRIEIRYNMFPSEKEEEGEYRKKAVTRYYKQLYSDVKNRSCIVFTNSRDSAEKTSRSLGRMAELNGRPGEVFIHHGSVSAELRHNAEEALKNKDRKNTVVATVTLELGIDVGNLDRIVQIGAPYTCSSMVQRMGRSGRRGGTQNMVVYCNDDLAKYWTEIDGISMDLVRSIAMSELVLRDGWVEPAWVPRLPYSLLYHQTMQYLKPGLGARYGELRENVLSMYPFRNITEDDYKWLLKHLVSIGHLERMEDGTYLIGTKGEKVSFNREFCSVFTTGKEFEIKFEGKSIGSIQQIPSVGELIQLAGRVWEVKEVSMKDYHADVVESDGTVNTPWTSGIPGLDTRILRRMRDVLLSIDSYDYLDKEAENCLRHCREMGKELGVSRVFSERSRGFRMYPWVGSRQFDTLKRVLTQIDDVGAIRCRQPYYIDVVTDLSERELRSAIARILNESDGTDLIGNDDDLRIGKYDEYVPDELLVKQFAADQLDVNFQI
ncbi:MAG: DEAD/DEAH box helicase [archaeon]|nr:DEAD/DEAH box helicase [archaeon]